MGIPDLSRYTCPKSAFAKSVFASNIVPSLHTIASDMQQLPHTPMPHLIEISIAILDKSYECGDLYITMQDSTGKTISQNGYFKECFVDDGVDLPTSETYSEKADQRGKYTIEAKMYDSDHTNSIHVKETFYIR